jgi:hypothetical protein
LPAGSSSSASRTRPQAARSHQRTWILWTCQERLSFEHSRGATQYSQSRARHA